MPPVVSRGQNEDREQQGGGGAHRRQGAGEHVPRAGGRLWKFPMEKEAGEVLERNLLLADVT